MNKIILIGRTTSDIELKSTTSNISYCKFTLAVNRKFTNAKGEKQTDFINCIAWKILSETLVKYVKKGQRIAISGSLQIRNYEAENDEKRYVSEAVIEDVTFIEKKENADVEPKEGVKSVQKSYLDPIDDEDLPF